MHAPDWLKIDQGEFDHISKCWTLISKGRTRWPSLLYYSNTDIYSIILILQWLLLYSYLQLDSVRRTESLISRGELQSSLPYLKHYRCSFGVHLLLMNHKIFACATSSAIWCNLLPFQHHHYSILKAACLLGCVSKWLPSLYKNDLC